MNENVRTLSKISLKFVPKGPINNNPALVKIMAWRRPGDKPLSDPMMVSLLTHICVTRPQWVNSDVQYLLSHLLSTSFNLVLILKLYIALCICCALCHFTCQLNHVVYTTDYKNVFVWLPLVSERHCAEIIYSSNEPNLANENSAVRYLSNIESFPYLSNNCSSWSTNVYCLVPPGQSIADNEAVLYKYNIVVIEGILIAMKTVSPAA